jgi:hypothetical protein
MNIAPQLGQLPTFDELVERYPDYFEQALTAKEAAVFIDSTPAALAQMRSRGTGPHYIRFPTSTSMDRRGRPRGPIRYIRRDLIEWLQSQHSFENTAQEVIGSAPPDPDRAGNEVD